MKLPPRGDPKGEMDGALPRPQVLDALFRMGVAISSMDEETALLSQDEAVEMARLPPLVTGSVIRHLARAFAIPVTEFYFPPREKLN